MICITCFVTVIVDLRRQSVCTAHPITFSISLRTAPTAPSGETCELKFIGSLSLSSADYRIMIATTLALAMLITLECQLVAAAGRPMQPRPHSEPTARMTAGMSNPNNPSVAPETGPAPARNQDGVAATARDPAGTLGARPPRVEVSLYKYNSLELQIFALITKVIISNER